MKTPGTGLPSGPGPGGDETLVVLVYEELRALAERCLREERPGHTLQPTALVHEAWLRLAGSGAAFADREHFVSAAARAMRRVLVDHARRRRAGKRGGGALRVSLDEDVRTAEAPDLDVVALSDALDALARADPELAHLVELRYFCGLTLEETGRVIGRSVRQVEGSWAAARAFLYRAMGGAAARGEAHE